VVLAVVPFVLGSEQPTTELEYANPYREYRRNVRGWLPRVRPWLGEPFSRQVARE
jgi:protein-S-isoprenylcysteine O-methyltransferase Ste14